MFHFKQFDIEDNGATMKVGTDAVLLASVCAKNHNTNTSNIRILDIGTGCGIVALIMAQKFKNAIVDAIDIDVRSIELASRNFVSSPWSVRLNALQCSLQDYTANEAYEIIVSNPPYFHNSLKNTTTRKTLARHDDSLPLDSLFSKVKQLMAEEGSFTMIYPQQHAEEPVKYAEQNGLYLNGKTNIMDNSKSRLKLSVMTFKNTAIRYTERDLVLHAPSGIYTEEYRQLVSDLYLWA